MIELLVFIKLSVAIVFVIGLSLLAENLSPKIAGILSGYPTGSAISLFFFGLEEGADFAAQGAVYNMIGLTGALSFAYAYYCASSYFKSYSIVKSSLVAISAYLLVVWLLSFMEMNRYLAIGIPAITAFLAMLLFKKTKNIQIKKKAPLSYKTLVLRGFFAALIIVVVTSAPKYFSASWAGLFSAFPTTLFPLMIIIHYTYSRKHVHTLLKNVPIGMFSLIIYSLSVSIVYPLLGIYWGTLASFGFATLYLLVFMWVKKKIKSYQKAYQLKPAASLKN